MYLIQQDLVLLYPYIPQSAIPCIVVSVCILVGCTLYCCVRLYFSRLYLVLLCPSLPQQCLPPSTSDQLACKTIVIVFVCRTLHYRPIICLFTGRSVFLEVQIRCHVHSTSVAFCTFIAFHFYSALCGAPSHVSAFGRVDRI
jgi:hypothetical protein